MVIPTIVLAEIAYLYSRRRIPLDLTTVLSHIGSTVNCVIAPLDEAIVKAFPTALDIHDAIIVATALLYQQVMGENVIVITKDAEITASGLVKVVW